MTPQPTPNQIYRHIKHDPETGKWYEYKVLYIVSPPERESMLATTNFIIGTGAHTELDTEHALIGCRDKVYASPCLNIPHVAYKVTKGDGPIWLKPVDMFMDGRFELADAPQAGEP